MEKFSYSREQVEAYLTQAYKVDETKKNIRFFLGNAPKSRTYFADGGYAEFGATMCQCGETEVCSIYAENDSDVPTEMITICEYCYRTHPTDRIDVEGFGTVTEKVLSEITDGVFATNGEPQNIYDNAADFREMIENDVRDLQAFTSDEVDADEWEGWKAKLDLADAKQVRKIYRAFLTDGGSPVLFASDADYSF